MLIVLVLVILVVFRDATKAKQTKAVAPGQVKRLGEDHLGTREGSKTSIENTGNQLNTESNLNQKTEEWFNYQF